MAYIISGHIVHDGDLAFTYDHTMGIVVGDTVRCPDKVTSITNAVSFMSSDDINNDRARQVYTALHALVTKRRTPLPMTRYQPVNGDLVVTTQLDVGVLLGDAIYCANHIVRDSTLGVVDVHKGQTIKAYHNALLAMTQDTLMATGDDLLAHACPLSTKLMPGHVYINTAHNTSALVYLGIGSLLDMNSGGVKHGHAALFTALGNVLDLNLLLRHGRTPGGATEREMRNLAVIDHKLVTNHLAGSHKAQRPYIEIYPQPFGVTVDLCQIPGWGDGELRVVIDNHVQAVFTPMT